MILSQNKMELTDVISYIIKLHKTTNKLGSERFSIIIINNHFTVKQSFFSAVMH